MSTNPESKSEPESSSIKAENKRKRDSDEKPSQKKTKKYEHSEQHELSGYNKKQILNHLERNGCNTKMFEKALSSFKVSKESAVEFFQKHIDDAEENVFQECDSLCFDNIADWLKLFKECKFNDVCNYEQAIVMNAIAYNEKHPDPKDVGGVDLGKAYEFLAKGFMGLPQNELNKETAKFLASEFDLLVEEANTDKADKETKELKCKLQTPAPLTTTKPTPRLSLDPLQLQPEL